MMKVTIKLKQGRCMMIKIMRVIIRTPKCGRFQYTPSKISRELRHNHEIDHWSDGRFRSRFDFLGCIFWFIIVTA